MALATMICCDICTVKLPWDDMLPHAIPEGWRSYTITESDDNGEMTDAGPWRVIACGSHDQMPIAKLLARGLR